MPSLPFGLFFLLVLTSAWTLRRHRRARNATLLLASVWFYAAWDVRFLALLAFSCLAGYLGGEAVDRATGRRRRLVLWTANGTQLAILGLFKYYDFFRLNLDRVAGSLGLASHLPLLELVFPVGISFYTFQGIAYVTDLHRGRGLRAKSFADYALFLSFFPKLIAGPICRARDLLPQIEAEPPAGVPDLSLAVSLLASGVFKKVVLATYLQTRLVDAAFAVPENHSSLELLLALYAYSAQVYADFSGYTDLALGCALLLGFRLPANFDAPYAATSIGDFWRRWHISFSSWLRDYVYFPLGGSRGSPARTYLNLVVTFVVGGLWHGARWGFVVWGGVHGVALAAQKAFRDVQRARGRDPDAAWPAWATACSWLATLQLCVFARVFFRAGDLQPAWGYLQAIGTLRIRGEGIDLGVLLLTLLVLGMNLRGAAWRESFIGWHESLPAVVQPGIWAAVAMAAFALQPAGVLPYIYLRF